MKHIIANGFARSYSTEYKQFKGVDFSTDAVSIDKERSPWAPNMISDAGGMPEKRMGWRSQYRFGEMICEGWAVDRYGRVHGIYPCTIVTTDYLIVHIGCKIYNYPASGVPVLLYTMTSNYGWGTSSAVFFNDKLYLWVGSEYLVFNGSTIVPVVGYTPTVTIGRAYNGGGTAFEPLNYLTSKSTDSFYITKAVFEAPTKTYFTSMQALDALSGTSNPVIFSILNPGGSWESYSELSVNESDEPYFTVDRTAGSVTLSDWWYTALVNGGYPTYVDGVDNIRITVYKTRTGDANRIKYAKISTLYNGFVFCTRGLAGVDYRSAFNDPTYFPVDGYDNVGSSNSNIMGYLRVGKYLAIVKEDNDQDSTVFFRYDTTDADGNVIFIKENAITGVGAAALKCFGILNGEPLFLSREGVHAIVSNALTDERIVQSRSGFVDPLLTAEDNLEDAIGIVWGKKYIVCVNDKAYVLDASQNKTNKGYECFYWTNIPATCFAVRDGELYFGTDNGYLCKFNTDVEDSSKYSDTLGTTASAIDASWSTKIDDDGNFAEKKSLMRAGTALLVKPYTISSVEVALTTDRTFKATVSNHLAGIFDFSELDFAYLDFNTLDTPRVIPIMGNFRRYNTLQITVRNAVVNQGFGVYGIIKRFYKCGVVR